MAQSQHTLVHGPAGVHHGKALAVIAMAVVLLTTMIMVSLLRTAPVPFVADPPPAATAAPWLRDDLQSVFLTHIADHGSWGVGVAHPVAKTVAPVDALRNRLQSEYLLGLARTDRWSYAFPSVALADNLQSDHLLRIAAAGRWGEAPVTASWPAIRLLDRLESEYLRGIARTGSW